eukprot:g27697.t1
MAPCNSGGTHRVVPAVLRSALLWLWAVANEIYPADLLTTKVWLDRHVFNGTLVSVKRTTGHKIFRTSEEKALSQGLSWPLARPTMCFIGLGRASLEMYVVRSPGFLDMLLKESPALATEAMTQLFPDLDIVLVDVQEPLISRSSRLPQPSAQGRQPCQAIHWSLDAPAFSFYKYRELFYSLPYTLAVFNLQGCNSPWRLGDVPVDRYYCEYLYQSFEATICGKINENKFANYMDPWAAQRRSGRQELYFPMLDAGCGQSICLCYAHSDAYHDFNLELLCKKDGHKQFMGQWGQDRFLVENVFGIEDLHGRGIYVDVGSSHPFHLSNTAFLDTCLKWRGVCLEPNPRLKHSIQGLRSSRCLGFSMSNVDHVERSCTVVEACAWANKTKMKFANGLELAARTTADDLKPSLPGEIPEDLVLSETFFEALRERLAPVGSLEALERLFLQWGITTARKLSWTSPERFGKLLDALPVSMAQAQSKTQREVVNEEATRTDFGAREAAKGMIGQSGRLLREKLQQHFEGAWYPLLTRDVLNTALLRQDWAMRSSFMNGYIPRTNLIPLYGYGGLLRSDLALRMTAEEGATSLMPCLHGFELVFQEFTRGILKDVFDLASQPKQRIFAAGGAILACCQLWRQPALEPLYRIAASEGGYFESLRKLHIGRSPQVLANIMEFAAADTKTRAAARKKADQLWLPNATARKRNAQHNFGFTSSDGSSFERFWGFRDQRGYDGKNVWGLPRTLRSLQTGFNFVEPAKLRRWSTGPRIMKYKKRGFGTIFFEICKHSPRCDLPETLDDETARRIAALQGFTTAQNDFGYGDVELPFTARMVWGMHLDIYMETHEQHREERRAKVESNSCGLWEPADNDLVAGKYIYIAGNDSASEESIEQLLAVKLETHGLPGVRWKNTDLWESRRGNEFLPRCYMCRSRIDPSGTLAERPRLCACCEAISVQKRQQEADLSGKKAIVTGGRVNIGYATALRLLRLGAEQWLSRLSVYGSDFRSVPLVAELGDKLALAFPRLDILINNAAQTVRRPAAHYAELVRGEAEALEQRLEARIMQASDLNFEPVGMIADASGSGAMARAAPGAVEEMKDDRAATSWTAKIGDISWVESLEVQVVNVTAPFTLLSKLKPCLLVKDEPLKLVQTFTSQGWVEHREDSFHHMQYETFGASDLLSLTALTDAKVKKNMQTRRPFHPPIQKALAKQMRRGA